MISGCFYWLSSRSMATVNQKIGENYVFSGQQWVKWTLTNLKWFHSNYLTYHSLAEISPPKKTHAIKIKYPFEDYIVLHESKTCHLLSHFGSPLILISTGKSYSLCQGVLLSTLCCGLKEKSDKVLSHQRGRLTYCCFTGPHSSHPHLHSL